MEHLSNWAWENKDKLDNQTYITFMNLLKNIYEDSDKVYPHKIKIVKTSNITLPSEDWIDNNDPIEEYDSISADIDNESISVEVTTERIYSCNLNCLIKEYSNWTDEGNIVIKKELTKCMSAENFNSIFLCQCLTLAHHNKVNEFKSLYLDNKRYYEDFIRTTVAYIIPDIDIKRLNNI